MRAQGGHMKLRCKIVLTLAIAESLSALHVRGGEYPSLSNAPLVEVRRALRQEGFKVELSDFDFSKPSEVRARGIVLTNAWAAIAGWRGSDDASRRNRVQDVPTPMEIIRSNVALVAWR